MKKYQITITHTSGKNAGLKVSYTKKRLDIILHMAEEAIKAGDVVEIKEIEIIENFDKVFCEAIMDACRA